MCSQFLIFRRLPAPKDFHIAGDHMANRLQHSHSYYLFASDLEVCLLIFPWQLATLVWYSVYIRDCYICRTMAMLSFRPISEHLYNSSSFL